MKQTLLTFGLVLLCFVGFFGGLSYFTPITECKEDTLILNIISLRVDDDGEYHVTGSSVKSGTVSSFSDVRSITIQYTNTEKPKMYIPINSCTQKNESFYTYRTEVSRRIELPVNYKIETFDD